MIRAPLLCILNGDRVTSTISNVLVPRDEFADRSAKTQRARIMVSPRANISRNVQGDSLSAKAGLFWATSGTIEPSVASAIQSRGGSRIENLRGSAVMGPVAGMPSVYSRAGARVNANYTATIAQ